MRSDSSEPVNIAHTPATEMHPSWTPDGGQVAFRSDESGTGQIHIMNVDGSRLRLLTGGR